MSGAPQFQHLATEYRPASDAADAFRNESREIGEGPGECVNPPQRYTLEEMLEQAVFISEGSQVALRSDPRCAWSFNDFANLTAASASFKGEKKRRVGIAKDWLSHPKRQTVHTRTFRAGGDLFCRSPEDMTAINTWREPPRAVAPIDWRERIKPFLEHVAYLVPVLAEREFFLDWLAHAEQQPGVLPHVHTLMYTPRHGIGRNWLTSVLARVWPGVTALDVDLPALLDGKFNGRLSRKIFAVVNEVREGGHSSSYRHADRLRTLLTDEVRHIDPKYGRQYSEFNAVRWLMLSNHESALPLDRFDRRVYAIRNAEEPRGADYYTSLYAMAADPLFVASVREALRARDISGFNPGMHAPLTDTKRRVVEASMSDAEIEMEDVVNGYPGDCITTDKLASKLFGTDSTRKDRAALRFVAPRAGATKYPRRIRLRLIQHRVWVLRNHASWLRCSAEVVAQEVDRGERCEELGETYTREVAAS